MTRTLIFTLLLATTQSGWTDQDSRKMPQFSKILLMGSIHAEIRQGRSHELQITADSDDLDRLRAEVIDGQLRLWLEDTDSWFGWWRDTGEVHVTITLSDLEELNMRGSGNVLSDALALKRLDIALNGSGDLTVLQLSTESLQVQLAGSGDIEINKLNAEDTAVVVRGSGDISMFGDTTSLEATVQGSGTVNAGALRATHASIAIQGSGDVDTFAEATLHGTIQGSGNISYRGDAEVVSTVQGSGNIVQM